MQSTIGMQRIVKSVLVLKLNVFGRGLMTNARLTSSTHWLNGMTRASTPAGPISILLMFRTSLIHKGNCRASAGCA